MGDEKKQQTSQLTAGKAKVTAAKKAAETQRDSTKTELENCSKKLESVTASAQKDDPNINTQVAANRGPNAPIAKGGQTPIKGQ